ncbi:hypothetical protein CSOJ01_08094 [Colletotrichum sojae]|uniref:Uncharacterized protein n=1 Tax=Colletotrichum sojae TaxID=2175907 RepID=A0A8H6J6T7_9PEZI|nr:hypothetical protein CSOJ01_08094 [Colletotrichum sojae]
MFGAVGSLGSTPAMHMASEPPRKPPKDPGIAPMKPEVAPTAERVLEKAPEGGGRSLGGSGHRHGLSLSLVVSDADPLPPPPYGYVVDAIRTQHVPLASGGDPRARNANRLDGDSANSCRDVVVPRAIFSFQHRVYCWPAAQLRGPDHPMMHQARRSPRPRTGARAARRPPPPTRTWDE